MRSFRLLSLLASLPVLCVSARAADDMTKLQLSATGNAKAPPTLLTATLNAQADSVDAAAAQAHVNALSAAAAKQAASLPALHLSIQDYNVSQSDDKSGKAHWTAQQSLVLSGTDAEAVLKLTGQYQAAGLTLSGLSWSLDDKTRDALLRQAREDALVRLKNDAADAAHVMGLHVRSFQAIRIETPFPTPRPMLMMARMAAPTAPQSSGDAQTLTVTVSADVMLSP